MSALDSRWRHIVDNPVRERPEVEILGALALYLDNRGEANAAELVMTIAERFHIAASPA